MTRKQKPIPLLYSPRKTVTVDGNDIKGMEAIIRRLRGPRENVVANLERIIATCATASERCKADADALAEEARGFRQRFEVGDANDFAGCVHQAMQIAAKFEVLRAEHFWGHASDVGNRVIDSGGAEGGDHEAFKDWARKEVAAGRSRGLAKQAIREGITNLKERQARQVLTDDNIIIGGTSQPPK
jgi:hypothetical protein